MSELIERIIAEISALEADIATFKNALGDDAELDAEIKILAVLMDCKAALSQQSAVTDDMRYAVRFAPRSAHWSERLREFFGPDARRGIDALESQLRAALSMQEAEPVDVREVFIAGFRYCATEWAERDDLFSDVHSAKFAKEMEVILNRDGFLPVLRRLDNGDR